MKSLLPTPSFSHPGTLFWGNQWHQFLTYSTRSILYRFRQIHNFLIFKTSLTQKVHMLFYPSFWDLILCLKDYLCIHYKDLCSLFFIDAYSSTVWMHSIYLIKLAKQKPFCTTACKDNRGWGKYENFLSISLKTTYNFFTKRLNWDFFLNILHKW